MPADDHGLDAQRLDGVLQDGQAVEVGMHDEVGNVAMNEHLPGWQSDDLIGWHTAVGAADPQILRRLLGGEALDEIRIGVDYALRPAAVFLR